MSFQKLALYSGWALLLLSLQSEADIVTPNAINVIHGAISEQGVGVLGVLDQTGVQDDWEKYLEFAPGDSKFSGTFSRIVLRRME